MTLKTKNNKTKRSKLKRRVPQTVIIITEFNIFIFFTNPSNSFNFNLVLFQIIVIVYAIERHVTIKTGICFLNVFFYHGIAQ